MNEPLGAKIQALRKSQGKGIRKVAVEAGLSRSYLSLIEAGKRNPTLATLQKLAEALGCHVSFLLPN